MSDRIRVSMDEIHVSMDGIHVTQGLANPVLDGMHPMRGCVHGPMNGNRVRASRADPSPGGGAAEGKGKCAAEELLMESHLRSYVPHDPSLSPPPQLPQNGRCRYGAGAAGVDPLSAFSSRAGNHHTRLRRSLHPEDSSNMRRRSVPY
jgi:hypothetical protein